MKKTTLFLSILVLVSAWSIVGSKATATEKLPELETVDFVDLEKYSGKWYEVASIPKNFQKGCSNTTAEYSRGKRGNITVINTCTVNGKQNRGKATAFIADKSSNSKLKVQFFWPFRGDYWIIELDENYEYAVVGSPDRESLWILSRHPYISPVVLEELFDKIENKHLYDLSKIQISTNN